MLQGSANSRADSSGSQSKSRRKQRMELHDKSFRWAYFFLIIVHRWRRPSVSVVLCSIREPHQNHPGQRRQLDLTSKYFNTNTGYQFLYLFVVFVDKKKEELLHAKICRVACLFTFICVIISSSFFTITTSKLQMQHNNWGKVLFFVHGRNIREISKESLRWGFKAIICFIYLSNK